MVVLLASLIFTISNASSVSIMSVNATELLNASVIEDEERNSTGTQGQKVQSNVAGN